MNKRNLVLGYYQNQQTANTVLKKLRRAGMRRSAAIQVSNGKHIDNYAPWKNLGLEN